MLEPYEGKLSRTVLRGERDGNVPALPGERRKTMWRNLIVSSFLGLVSFGCSKSVEDSSAPMLESIVTEQAQPESPDVVDPASDLAPILFVFTGTEAGVNDGVDKGEFAQLINGLRDAEIDIYFKALVAEGDSDCLLLHVKDRDKAIQICRAIAPEPTWVKYCAWNRKDKRNP